MTIIDQTVEAVRQDLLDRSQVGLKKYGVPLDRTDLGLRDWLQHAYEETLDQANYLKRSIIELDRKIKAGEDIDPDTLRTLIDYTNGLIKDRGAGSRIPTFSDDDVALINKALRALVR